ncbi:related to ketoreductases [Phialocephala subalpina]|uniref:Related to ketoreductases n=1 Tax=Phialocephala subalpina TaxID=576137 RepID=A0A1L7WCF3_9HELO|nr:related to ketoreductases [Phialocephala subalpina]
MAGWITWAGSAHFPLDERGGVIEHPVRVQARGRKLEDLKHLEQAGAAILQLDITDGQQNINDTIAKAISIYGRVDVLVNNASYISIGTWEDLEYGDFLAQFDTNVFGTIKVTRPLLPHFRQRRAGTIVFISFLSGWIGHAGCSAYAGSKNCGRSLAGNRTLGIKTLLIEPGRFRTKLLSKNKMKAVISTIPEYAEFSKTRVATLSKEDQAQPGDPVKLVETILDLVRQEGITEGREVPFRLPLGRDVYGDMKTKCEETLKLLEEWKTTIRSTDLEE